MTFNERRNRSLLSTWTHSISPAQLADSRSFVTGARHVLLPGIQTVLSVPRKAAACCSQLATQLAVLAQDFYVLKNKSSLYLFSIHSTSVPKESASLWLSTL